MPTLSFGAGVVSLDVVIGHVAAATDADAELLSSTPTALELRSGDILFDIAGTFELDAGGDVTTGTITDIVATGPDGQIFQISDFGLDLYLYKRASFLEALGQAGEVERLIMWGDWTYEGTAGADVIAADLFSPDGDPIEFAGNDIFRLRGGADEVFAGAGRDRVFGGAGDDRLSGEGGRDRLFGEGGDDTLSGGAGDDRLIGDAGRDRLSGNGGDDEIDGGAGRDTLIGGGGADTFIFHAGDGRDVIRDFEDGTDVLSFAGLNPLMIIDHARGTLIEYEGGSVLVLDVKEWNLELGQDILI